MSGISQKEAYRLAGIIAKQFPKMFDVVVGACYVIEGDPIPGKHPTLFVNAVPTGEFFWSCCPIQIRASETISNS